MWKVFKTFTLALDYATYHLTLIAYLQFQLPPFTLHNIVCHEVPHVHNQPFPMPGCRLMGALLLTLTTVKLGYQRISHMLCHQNWCNPGFPWCPPPPPPTVGKLTVSYFPGSTCYNSPHEEHGIEAQMAQQSSLHALNASYSVTPWSLYAVNSWNSWNLYELIILTTTMESCAPGNSKQLPLQVTFSHA